MKVYRVVYKSKHYPEWWEYYPQDGNGVYNDIGSARRVATKVGKEAWRGITETAILESDTEWATVEFKERNV